MITVVLALAGGFIVCEVFFLSIVEDQGVEENDGEQYQDRVRTTGRLKVSVFEKKKRTNYGGFSSIAFVRTAHVAVLMKKINR